MANLILIAASIILLYTVVFFKEKTTIQIMLLGVQISIVGGFLVIDPNSPIGNTSYILLLFGFLITGAGFAFKK